MMQCVTTVSYSISFNGVLQPSFTPSRGLRQGDPLSAYVLLFVVDGLSTLLNKEVEERRIQAPSIYRRAPLISNLLFADDSLLFFKGDMETARRIKEVLRIYATSTGQLINPGKCSIMFGSSCPLDTNLCGVLHIEQ